MAQRDRERERRRRRQGVVTLVKRERNASLTPCRDHLQLAYFSTACLDERERDEVEEDEYDGTYLSWPSYDDDVGDEGEGEKRRRVRDEV